MKNYAALAFICITLLSSCKTDTKQVKPNTKEIASTILEKVALANGYHHWKDVASIKFTFNVDRDSSHFERTWLWQTNTHQVTMLTRQDTITYNRKFVDSTMISTDSGFINDKFWLLAPYQLVWDKNNFTYDYIKNIEAPISKKPMHKLTTVYAKEGGYTPGDAYDYYFEDDFIIKEWAFRKENQKEPNMVTTWEDYKNLKGLNISTMHKRPNSNFSLYFTSVTIE